MSENCNYGNQFLKQTIADDARAKMNIMVFDVAAEHSGALSVLYEIYNTCKNDSNASKNWIFVVSKPVIEETGNVKVLRFPWIKKSWLHRLCFDHFVAHRLISQYKADEVISLQNIMIPHTSVKQTVYIHNSLPFVQHKFSLLKNPKLWVYQNIIGHFIFHSIRNANTVVVQTEWMKRACEDVLKEKKNKFIVKTPKIMIDGLKIFEPGKDSFSTFFYPASGEEYKNHKIIVDACMELMKAGPLNFLIVFTLSGNESKNIAKLYEKAKMYQLPIDFVGKMPRQEVFNYYSCSVLIFPSYIETVGLPLIEAKNLYTPILVSDCDYSREILNDYEKVSFFDPFNSKDLANKISEIVKDGYL